MTNLAEEKALRAPYNELGISGRCCVCNTETTDSVDFEIDAVGSGPEVDVPLSVCKPCSETRPPWPSLLARGAVGLIGGTIGAFYLLPAIAASRGWFTSAVPLWIALACGAAIGGLWAYRAWTTLASLTLSAFERVQEGTLVVVRAPFPNNALRRPGSLRRD